METKKEIRKILKNYSLSETDILRRNDEKGNSIKIDEEVSAFLSSLKMPFEVSLDDMFQDDSGEIVSISIAWYENQKVELIVEPIYIC